VQAGHLVVVLDNLATGSLLNLCQGAELLQADLTDAPCLQRCLGELQPEVVFHCAGLKAAGESMVRPAPYAQVNIAGTLQLLQALAGCGHPPVIFSSTAAVYGSPAYLPLDEKHPLRPVNFYGHTKAAAEELLAWWHRLHQMPYAALRYFNAAGGDLHARMPGIEPRPQNLLPLVLDVAEGRRDHLDLFGEDYPTRDGTCLRDYIHVADLVEAHLLAMKHLLQRGGRLVLNLGSGQTHSVREVIDCARTITGRPIPVRVAPRRAGDEAELYASYSSAEAILGWRPLHSQLNTLVESAWQARHRAAALS